MPQELNDTREPVQGFPQPESGASLAPVAAVSMKTPSVVGKGRRCGCWSFVNTRHTASGRSKLSVPQFICHL